MTRLTILFVLVILFHENCGQMHQTFFKNGVWKAPSDFNSVTVVLVGGGAGGTNGYMAGGAGGHIVCSSTFRPNPNQEYAILVGKGGRGADTMGNINDIEGCTNGGTSSFANKLFAAGGEGCSNKIKGNNGGTGSGAACWGAKGGECSGPDAMGGRGGSRGSDGGASSDGIKGGKGQGDDGYSDCLKLAKQVKLTAGDGGDPSYANCKDNGVCWGPGSGGGGVLVNGKRPDVNDGLAVNPKLAGEGGKGYGAGGGGGGYQKVGGIGYRFGGGNGNDGFVHIEVS